MWSKEFEISPWSGIQHTESSIDGSMENSILVEKPTSCRRAHKISHNREAKSKSMPHINIWSRSKHASKHRPLMIPLLGNVVENKKNRAYVAITQDHLWRLHTRFRSCLTNRCSRSRVGEDRWCRSPQLGIYNLPTARISIPRTVPRTGSSKKGRKHNRSTGIHTYNAEVQQRLTREN